MKRPTPHTGTPSFVIGMMASWLLLALSCGNPTDSSDTDDCGPGIIIPGVCIDGVRVGDSRERVEELLGEPSNAGWADGLYRAWRTYNYKQPGAEGLGFSILFIEEEDLSWGPVDALRSHAPYEGKTTEGIRIGSTLNEVKNTYGEPDYIVEKELKGGNKDINYTYCLNSKKFSIGTRDEIVTVFLSDTSFLWRKTPLIHVNNAEQYTKHSDADEQDDAICNRKYSFVFVL